MRGIKIAGVVIALCGAIVLAISCGGDSGGGGGTTPQQAINNSALGFGNIIDSIVANPEAVCTPKTVFECTCPNGGTVDLDDTAYSLTFNSCKSDSLTYTGTVQTDLYFSTLTVNMTQFGECTNVNGTITGVDVDNCSGTLTGTCAGQTVTCTMSADCETCTI